MNRKYFLSTTVDVPLILTAHVAKKAEIKPTLYEGRVKPGPEVTIAIIYDNNEYDSRLTTAWGFSCIVRFPQKIILFDTGGDSAILLSNMVKLGINPEEINTVVLSHAHGDHTGGLNDFLK